MAAIGSVEYFNDAEMGEKCVTEMKPYSVYGGIGSDRREVYVILPVGVKYNPGVTRIFDNDGFIKPLPPFIDGSSGIPALASGRTITFISKIQKNNGIETYYQQAQLSLSILSKDISKKVFLNRLKQNVQVLFESENSLVTKVKTARIFSSAYDETLVKTMISGDARGWKYVGCK